MGTFRLGILDTHPIQYHAPYYRALTGHPKIRLEVVYCHRATAQEQADAGFGVAFNWDSSLLEGYRYRFLRNVAHTPTIAGFWGLDTPELGELIANRSFDAVLVNGWHYKSAWQAIWACWRTRTPVMVRSDSHLLTARSAVKSLGKALAYRAFIPRFDMCLPVGCWSHDYFLHYGASPQRITIVPHTIDESWFAAQIALWLPARAEARRAWGLDQEAVVFLFAGKFIEKKRPLDFVRAVHQAAQAGAPMMGLMVGDGMLRSECEAYVRENNVPLRFVGFLNQSQIVRAYVAADALVLPSDARETWGLVVNEALACGRPCLVSDRVGSGPDLIKTPCHGSIYPMGDVDALSREMFRFATSGKVETTSNQIGSLLPPDACLQFAVEQTLTAVEAVAGQSAPQNTAS